MLISEDDIIRCSSRREGQALEENLGAGISRGGRGLARPPLSGLPPAHCKTACIPHRHYIACFYCFIIIYHQIIHFLTIKSTISLFAPLQKKCLTNKNRSAIWMHCCCKDAPFTSSPSFLQRNHDPCALFYCSRLFFLYILLTYSLILIILRIFLRCFWFAIYQDLDGSMSAECTMQFWCVGARIMSYFSRFCPSIDDAIRTRIFDLFPSHLSSSLSPFPYFWMSVYSTFRACNNNVYSQQISEIRNN